VYGLVLLAALPGQFLESKEFSKEIQTKALEATVRIFHPASQLEGSGVAVRYEKNMVYILTAAHGLPEGPRGDDVDVYFYPLSQPAGWKPEPIRASVIARMIDRDLAVIRFPLGKPPPAVALVCPRESPTPQERPLPVLTCGIGIVGTPEILLDQVGAHKQPKRPVSRAIFWETDRVPTKGRSGGPMIDARGYVIGICSGTQNNKGYYTFVGEIQKGLEESALKLILRPGVSSD
jgi:hypothetical protein